MSKHGTMGLDALNSFELSGRFLVVDSCESTLILENTDRLTHNCQMWRMILVAILVIDI